MVCNQTKTLSVQGEEITATVWYCIEPRDPGDEWTPPASAAVEIVGIEPYDGPFDYPDPDDIDDLEALEDALVEGHYDE